MIPRSFTDEEYAILARNPEFRRFKSGTTCPVCLNTNKFLYQGDEWECPDDKYGHPQLRLAMLYWKANIDLEYQKLLWEEYPHADVKQAVDSYVEKYDTLRLSGAGMNFLSPVLGIGKTWAATRILKEVVQKGYDGWFANFFEVKSYYEINDRDERDFKINRIKEAEILVLDDVAKPYSKKQADFYADKLEELLRPRMAHNFPTIITSNMTVEDIEETFPRIFSLLCGKNIDALLSGTDYRTTDSRFETMQKLAWKGESRPIE